MPPRRQAAGAVVQRSPDLGTGGIRRRLREIRSCGGTDEGEFRGRRDAPVVFAHDRPQSPISIVALHLHDAQSVGFPFRPYLLFGGVIGVVSGKHLLRRRVLVIADQEEPVALALDRQEFGEVAVETELTGRRFGGLVVEVPARRTGDHWVTPADHDVARVALRDFERVFRVGGNRLESQSWRCRGRCAGGCFPRRTTGRTGLGARTARRQNTGAADGHRRRSESLEDGPSVEFAPHDVTKVFVLRRVRDRLGARIPALVEAGAMRATGREVQQVQQSTALRGQISSCAGSV